MRVINKIEPVTKHPIALLIGTFDGVHLGHVALIKKARALVGQAKEEGTVVLLSFDRPPSTFFSKEAPRAPLISFEEKALKLEKEGIDLLVVLPFNAEIAKMGYEEFLSFIREKIPFDHLVRGKGSFLGKNRLGDEEKIKELGQRWGFIAHYEPLETQSKAIISSSRIRKLLAEGNKDEAVKLLG